MEKEIVVEKEVPKIVEVEKYITKEVPKVVEVPVDRIVVQVCMRLTIAPQDSDGVLNEGVPIHVPCSGGPLSYSTRN